MKTKFFCLYSHVLNHRVQCGSVEAYYYCLKPYGEVKQLKNARLLKCVA